ncbi:uncharacterized protein PAC_11846 [Phialocephala subalpina]|uniref:Uncharacterized protein n=1 Tax=Phialocephala subalpina TaxID=576137 RepID=A0A1L7XAA1_9HELO|nr:uncharacterized protein PAC_11846 [Phialocephala subalpina]
MITSVISNNFSHREVLLTVLEYRLSLTRSEARDNTLDNTCWEGLASTGLPETIELEPNNHDRKTRRPSSGALPNCPHRLWSIHSGTISHLAPKISLTSLISTNILSVSKLYASTLLSGIVVRREFYMKRRTRDLSNAILLEVPAVDSEQVQYDEVLSGPATVCSDMANTVPSTIKEDAPLCLAFVGSKKPESTAVMSGMREYSFENKGRLRNPDILQTPNSANSSDVFKTEIA